MPDTNRSDDAAADELAAEEHVRQIMEPGVPDPVRVSSRRQDQPATAPEIVDGIFETRDPSDEAIGESADQNDPRPKDFDDPATDRAVDAITKAEADELLDAEDRTGGGGHSFIMKPSRWSRFKDGWASWWGSPVKRYGTIGVLIAIVIALGTVPLTRYFVLNTVGLRSHASVQVLDQTTNLPLKGVSVTLAGHTASTDANGQATFTHIELGQQTLKVHKLAFADYTTTVTVGLGGLSLPGIELKAVGSQFVFQLTDYLSGKGVASAEVSSGQAEAKSDAAGKAILTVQPGSGAALPIHISAAGYRPADFSINPTIGGTHAIQLVAAGKDVYVSNATGKYNLYSVDIDGKNPKLILPATGNETRNMQLSISPNNREVAFVSTRDNQRDADGYLLSTLTVLGTDGSGVRTLDHSEQISLLGWAGGRLLYEKVAAGASAANPARERIMSYDPAQNTNSQLASANNFDGLVLIGQNVYYATPGTNRAGGVFAHVSADGTTRKTVLNSPVWTLLRTGYDTLALQTAGGWLSYSISSDQTASAEPPASYAPEQYSNSPDGSRSLWIDTRDGKGALLSYDPASGKSRVVTEQTGLNQIVGWLNDDTVIYRVSNSQETADYAMSLNGGKPKKIVDVTDVQLAF